MGLFGLISVEIGSLSIDIELIIDIIVILIIIIVAVYMVFKTKKNDNGNLDKYDDEPGIDDKKGLVIEHVRKSWTKYKDIKGIIKSLLSILGMPILIIVAIFCLVGLGYSLYEFFTDQIDNSTIPSLIISPILLGLCILYFIKTKLLSDRIHKNIGFKIILLYVSMFISLFIVALGWFGSRYVLEKLNLVPGLSSLIQILCGFLSMFGGLLFTTYVADFLFSTRESSKTGTNKNIVDYEYSGNGTEDNGQTGETTEKNITYENLIDNNNKLEEKTGFHQGPLLE